MSPRLLGAGWLRLAEGSLETWPLHRMAGGCPQDSQALPAALEADGDLLGAPLTLRLVLSLGCGRRIVTVNEPKLKTWDQAPPERLSWVRTLGCIPSGAPFPGPGAVA